MNPSEDRASGLLDSSAAATSDPAPPLDDPRVLQAVEEYLAAVEAGGQPDRTEFLKRYPQIAAPLAVCLEGLQLVQDAAPQLRTGGEDLLPDGSAVVAPGHLGDFRLVREVGRGGMGIVYEAEQRSLGRRMALKVLPLAATLDPRRLQRFKNEAQAAAHLNHPHIVAVHSVGCERGVHYYAMQFIDGQSLAAVIAELRRHAGPPRQQPAPATDSEATASGLPAAASTEATARAGLSTERSVTSAAFFRTVAELGVQAAEALEHAHSEGVIHRDIKPANLLLDAQGKLWVTDFGLAHCQSTASLTLTGDLVGTLRYMSPEQALAKRVVIDHRTDLYSLGATLYELLTLEPVLAGSDRQELLRQIAFEEPRPPRRLNRAIPVELETIVHKALEKNPADRYATAQEMADDLRRFLNDEPIRARRPPLGLRLRKWCRRRRPLVASLAAGLLTLLVVGVVLAVGYQRRLLETERGVTSALVQAETLLEEGDKLIDHPERWQATARLAQEALKRAEELLAGGVATTSLISRVEKDRAAVESAIADCQLLITLNDIRLAKHALKDGVRKDLTKTAASYAKVLGDYGVDLAEPASAAARIRGSRLRDAIVGALEEWWRSTGDEQIHQHLDRVLEAVDPADAAQANWWDASRRGDSAALAKLAIQLPAKRLPPAVICSRAADLKDGKQWPGAERLLKEALLFHPGDFWLNHDLAVGVFQQDQTRAEEAVAYLRAALACQGDNPNANVLANIGAILSDSGKLEEAIPYLKRGIELDPQWTTSRQMLGLTLVRMKRVDEAIACYQTVLAIDPALPLVHYRLGLALEGQGKWDEAVACFQRAIALDPKFAAPHMNLGIGMNNRGKLDEAIASLQKAIEINPKIATAHLELGMALARKGQVEKAIACCKKAIELNPKYAEAHCNLGQVLRFQGRFAEALEELRRGDALGRQRPDWGNRSATWLREAEQLVALEAMLSKLLKGEVQPADAAERLALARMCQNDTKRYAAAACFYAAAFETQPGLAGKLDTQVRYDAACAAALAGCGQGDGAAQLSDQERARLREQALTWLRADLAAYAAIVDKGPAQALAKVEKRLRHWQQDSDFAGVRGPGAVAGLPQAERQAWRDLWTDVEKTLDKAQGKAASKEGARKKP
jgi:serine/threonine protein kinase/tetratricopeptide (TPR) repeat protein